MKKAKKEKRETKDLKYQVRISWSKKDGVYVAEVPELAGCATHGATYEEAARNVEDAIETWIEGAKESGYPIPEPLATKTFSGKFVARIDPELHWEVAVKAEEANISLNKFVEGALRQAVLNSISGKKAVSGADRRRHDDDDCQAHAACH
jgi:predicted RNase H-like HicB family nuclease